MNAGFENVIYFDEEALLDRLSDGLKERPREVVFVVGAPLNSPEEEGTLGVSGVAQIVEDIRGRFQENTSARQQLETQLGSSANKYQTAFQFLQGRRGQSACNEVVRNAVLRSRVAFQQTAVVKSIGDEQLREFDHDNDGWHLTSGAKALGALIAEQPILFGKTLLTSNFDPLIKVSIRSSGGHVWQTSLVSDAELGNTQADGCRIVHFHGYWCGTDTLHTGSQLLQGRPTLKSSLLEYLRDKLVVVVAYAGWEDIFTSVLKELTGSSTSFPEVLWTFYDSAPRIPGHLRSILQAGIDRGRVSLYAGINCHDFFPKLYSKWQQAKPDSAHSQIPILTLPGTSPTTSLKKLECDRPPNIDAWVGREAELRSLETNRSPVYILSGIGGQGKSLTAAKYIRESLPSISKYKFWDWRDCKEAADSIRTQVISAITRITADEITSDMLASATDIDLADLFVKHSIDAKTVFVFDNVDHYVDLENFHFVGLLNHLVKKFASIETTSQLILTCRPQVKYNETSIITIPMLGLSLTETQSLFAQRGVSDKDASLMDIQAAHNLTEGHPFWLGLISAQVAQVPGLTLPSLLEDLRRGREDTPDVLNSIWERLSEKDQILLRIMAEAVRPETKDTLEKCVSSLLRYSKFDKSLKSLIRLNLVVVKPELNAPDLYDLHPLVRQFIRKNFSRLERNNYIILVIRQYENWVSALRQTLSFSMPLSMLGRWTQKAELEVEAQQYKSAAKSLYDAIDALIGGGHSEEFVRVARIFLECVDWNTSPSDIREFDVIVAQFVECLNDFGDYVGADLILDRFRSTIPGKTARYIHYCDMMGSSLWKRADFDGAIEWIEAGIQLKNSTNVDTKYGSEHTLALARRDAGHVDTAMKYFLGNEELADLLNPKSEALSDNGPALGNIGRCLQLQGKFDDALTCYKKSIRALEKSSDSSRLSNQAYARQWISECLLALNDHDLAYCFVVSAEDLLLRFSPSRSKAIVQLKELIQANIPEKFNPPSINTANQLVRHWIKQS